MRRVGHFSMSLSVDRMSSVAVTDPDNPEDSNQQRGSSDEVGDPRPTDRKPMATPDT